jgi:hypothetical protein
MKRYQTIIDKVLEYRYKKGIVRLDTTSGLYKGSKLLYILSFVWLMLFQFIYILGSTFLFFADKLASNAEELFFSLLILTPLFIVGLVLLCLGKHAAALPFGVALPVLEMAQFYKNEMVSLSFLEKGILSKFFWFHFAPSILIIISSVIVCLIGIKTTCDFRKDYKIIMEKMYLKFKEENPNLGEEAWNNFLENGDKSNGNA